MAFLGTPTMLARYKENPTEEVLQGVRKVIEGSLGPDPSIWSLDNISSDMLFWLVLLKLGKKDPRAVERILISLFDNMGDSLHAYCKAGVGNRVTAWGSGALLAMQMERFGLITHKQAFDFVLGLNVITGAEIAQDVAELISILPKIAVDSDFPTTVVLEGDTRKRRFTIPKK